MLILFMLFVLEVVAVEVAPQETQTPRIKRVVVVVVEHQSQLDYIVRLNYQMWYQLSLLQEERVVQVQPLPVGVQTEPKV
jgi:hypothetical protein